MRDVSALARKAASQFGLLTSSDLRRLSFSEPSIASLVGQGILERLRRGLYVFGALDGRWEQELMRACLASARRGVVSHRSAQRLWDLRPWETVVEVTVRGGNAPRLEGAVGSPIPTSGTVRCGSPPR
jgi:predicted transcriptional regulator of viral defense system